MRYDLRSALISVALQVSRLVILHEEAEDGNAMPDLTRPVGAVSRAVDNLIKVSRIRSNHCSICSMHNKFFLRKPTYALVEPNWRLSRDHIALYHTGIIAFIICSALPKHIIDSVDIDF